MRTLLVHQGEKPLIGILEDGQLAEVFSRRRATRRKRCCWGAWSALCRG